MEYNAQQSYGVLLYFHIILLHERGLRASRAARARLVCLVPVEGMEWCGIRDSVILL